MKRMIIPALLTLPLLAFHYPQSLIDVHDWKQWHRLNAQILDSESHAAMVDIYVNPAARGVYESETAPYPVGAVIVKPLYADAERREFARLVVMAKMAPGYDPNNGDWWYGVGGEDGEEMYYQGKLRSCIACHKVVATTDYMFSQSVMAKIRGESGELATPLPDHSLLE